jgi:preprotein translocase subunit Sec61beta
VSGRPSTPLVEATGASAALLKVAFVADAMAKQTKGPGIQSAAGLIRYYDAEETSSVKIAPMFVIVFGILVGVGTVLMRVFWDF